MTCSKASKERKRKMVGECRRVDNVRDWAQFGERLRNTLKYTTPSDKMLVLGSGLNELPNLLFSYGYKKANVITIDNDTRMDADIYHDITKPLPFDNARFDVVIGYHVFEHIPFASTIFALQETYRVLNKKGVLLFAVPRRCWYLSGRLSFCRWEDIRFPPIVIHKTYTPHKDSFHRWEVTKNHNEQKVITTIADAGFKQVKKIHNTLNVAELYLVAYKEKKRGDHK